MHGEAYSLVTDRIDVIASHFVNQAKLLLHVLHYHFIMILTHELFVKVLSLVWQPDNPWYYHVINGDPLSHIEASVMHQHEQSSYEGCDRCTSAEVRHVQHVQ